MNKDLFKIDSDEVRRILSLHEERTKTQYLNIISEVSDKDTVPSLKTSKVNMLISGLNTVAIDKGTVFKLMVDKNNQKIARAVDVRLMSGSESRGWKPNGEKKNISYYCKTNVYYVGGNGDKYREFATNTPFTNRLKKELCNKEILKAGTYKSKGSYSLGNGAYVIPANTKYTKNEFGAYFKANYYGQMQLGTQLIATTNTATVAFSCNDNKFYVNKVGYTEDNGNNLTYKLKNEFCVGKPNKNQSVKSSFTPLHTIGQEHDLGNNVVIKPKDIIIKSFKYPDYAGIMRGNTAIAYFNCKTNTWSDSLLSDKKGLLTGTIKQKVCPQILSTSASTVSTSADTVSTSANTQTINTGNSLRGLNASFIASLSPSVGSPSVAIIITTF